MRVKYFLLLLLLISYDLLAETDCADQLYNQSAESVTQNNELNKLRFQLLDNQIESDIANGFPSAELLIIKDNKIVKHSVYGYSLKYNQRNDLVESPNKLQCNTLFDLASNTKMYATNYAIMHLVYLKKLDIDKSINYYIPEYKGCDQNGQCRESRTVRDLLTHSAGYMPDPQFFNPKSIATYGNYLFSQEQNLTESIILARLPFASPRGKKPVYSDVDFMLLGIIIERITKMSLDEYVAREIYKPLNLTRTTFNPLLYGFAESECAATELMGNTRGGTVDFPNIRKNTLQCEVHDEKAYYSMGGVSGHAGLFSTGYDLAVLTELMANNGSYNGVTLWNKSVENKFIAPLSSDSTYGLGWRRAGNNHNYAPFGHYASNLAYGHTGWTGTLTLIDPKYNLTIILLTNKKHSKFESNEFVGDKFATGKYYPIVDLIYQAFNIKNN